MVIKFWATYYTHRVSKNQSFTLLPVCNTLPVGFHWYIVLDDMSSSNIHVPSEAVRIAVESFPLGLSEGQQASLLRQIPETHRTECLATNMRLLCKMGRIVFKYEANVEKVWCGPGGLHLLMRFEHQAPCVVVRVNCAEENHASVNGLMLSNIFEAIVCLAHQFLTMQQMAWRLGEVVEQCHDEPYAPFKKPANPDGSDGSDNDEDSDAGDD